MGNRHGSMGVTINYDADLQASVETASVDKAIDIEADLKDKLQCKIKENEGVEATVTVDLDYYDKVDEVATFNVNIQFEDEGTVKFAEFDGDYYQPPDADDLIHEERDLEGTETVSRSCAYAAASSTRIWKYCTFRTAEPCGSLSHSR